jgi:hypothetical protein
MKADALSVWLTTAIPDCRTVIHKYSVMKNKKKNDPQRKEMQHLIQGHPVIRKEKQDSEPALQCSQV